MALDLNQIKEILQKPANRQVIEKAKSLQRRLRFHTEPSISPNDVGQPVTDFLQWVKGLLPKDKYNTFVQLFKFPLPTNTIVEDSYRELERVFNSRNASSFYQFSSPELEDDWNKYRRERLGEPGIWKTEGWNAMQVAPNSILVVDLPEKQESSRPEPYFYWLDIENVVDFKMDKSGGFKWLIFRQPKNKLAVFDDTYIRVFEVTEHNELGQLISESTHSLGYCPARFFWSDSLNKKSKALKKNPLVKELSNLDWYLFFATSKKHLDLYAPYPIYSAYEADCNFENNETGDYCDGGFLRNAKGEYKMLADGSIEKCPCCSEKRIAGPGSFLEIPAPNAAEGITDMRNPVQITTIDEKSLNYNVKECDRLKKEIITSIIGADDNVSDKEAINETQVVANFESKTAALTALKTNFEVAQKFVDDTVCRLRYGASFIDSSLNLGTDFYVFTIQELYNKYEKAKTNGASLAELDALSQQILEVEYKNNPLMLQRMLILKQLEPYPHNSVTEVISFFDKGLAPKESVVLKVNFTNFIDRFERENINILEFASELPMREKVTLINNKLKEYAKSIVTRTAPSVES